MGLKDWVEGTTKNSASRAFVEIINIF